MINEAGEASCSNDFGIELRARLLQAKGPNPAASYSMAREQTRCESVSSELHSQAVA